MSWSPDKPTEPGWWYYRETKYPAENAAQGIELAELVHTNGDLVPAHGGYLPISHPCWDGCLWAKATPPPLPGESPS